MKIKVKIQEQFNEKAFKVHSLNHYVDKRLYLFVYGQVVTWYGQVRFYNQLSVDKYTFLRFRHP